MDVLRRDRGTARTPCVCGAKCKLCPGLGRPSELLERLVLEKAPIIDTGRAQEFRTNGWLCEIDALAGGEFGANVRNGCAP